MRDKEKYIDYVCDILNSIKEIEVFIKGFDYDDFAKDRKTINAVIRSLEIVGEAAKKIPASMRSKYSEVPWKSMAGMRDKLIHEYSGVNLEIVWKTIHTNIPKIKPQIERIKEDLEN
jgi:uncharacterized protein with HEPN domain